MCNDPSPIGKRSTTRQVHSTMSCCTPRHQTLSSRDHLLFLYLYRVYHNQFRAFLTHWREQGALNSTICEAFMICVSSLQKPPFWEHVSAPVLLMVPHPTSERGLEGMRHKQEASSVLLLIKLLSPSSLGLPVFLKPHNTPQVNLSCNCIRSASHHNVFFSSLCSQHFLNSLPHPQPRSIPCSHQYTLLSTACLTSLANSSSHRGCSCSAQVLVGHLAW